MKLIKYDDPWNHSLSDFDQLLSRVFGERWTPDSLFGETAPDGRVRGFRLDSYVDDEGYHVVAELPGIPKEQIEIRLENAVLKIGGEHTVGEGENKRTFRFSRSLTVGNDIAADRVTAKMENGLLTIHLPKTEEFKPRAITVE